MAIKDFEAYTHELTDHEFNVLLPLLVAKLSLHKGKANSISNKQLREYIEQRTHKKINEPRVRKIAEHIRHSFLLENLVAGGKGYFLAENPEEMHEWLITMKQRRSAISTTIAAGEKAYKRMVGYKQPNQFKQRKATPGHTQPSIFQIITGDEN